MENPACRFGANGFRSYIVLAVISVLDISGPVLFCVPLPVRVTTGG